MFHWNCKPSKSIGVTTGPIWRDICDSAGMVFFFREWRAWLVAKKWGSPMLWSYGNNHPLARARLCHKAWSLLYLESNVSKPLPFTTSRHLMEWILVASWRSFYWCYLVKNKAYIISLILTTPFHFNVQVTAHAGEIHRKLLSECRKLHRQYHQIELCLLSPKTIPRLEWNAKTVEGINWLNGWIFANSQTLTSRPHKSPNWGLDQSWGAWGPTTNSWSPNIPPLRSIVD